MSEMLKPDSTLTFGKHRGQTIAHVFESDAGYLYWLMKDGFSNFGKEVTEAIFAWAESHPGDAKRIEFSVAKKRAEKAREAQASADSPLDTSAKFNPANSTVPALNPAAANPVFGSW